LGKPLVEIKEDGEADNPELNAQHFVERVWVSPTLKEDVLNEVKYGNPKNRVWVNLIIFNHDIFSNLTNPLNHMGYPKYLF
jgi:hypothetical protein